MSAPPAVSAASAASAASDVPTAVRPVSPWRSALPVLVALLAAVLLLYRDTVGVMVGIWWRSETFAHCLLVVPITLWLVWRQREQLVALTPRPQPAVLLLMAAAAVAWLLSDLVAVNVVSQFALMTLVILAVPAVLGLQVTHVILFPLLFLYFGVPFGEFVLPTMMEWTADFTVAALQLTGVPVYREGQQFFIPTGNWSVIDECSGVRYLMASLMVGTLFAYLNYRSYKRRIVFMGVAILVPIVANWLRAYMIVMLAHLSGNRIAVGVDHILYGWLFFGVIVFVMFMLGSRWSQADEVLPPSTPARVAPGSWRLQPMLLTAFAAAVIALLPPALEAALQRAEGAAAAPRLALPAQLPGGWSESTAGLVAWKPAYVLPSAEAARVYAAPAGTVGVYLAYYRGQTEERKLVSSQNMLVGMRDDHWNFPTNIGPRAVPVAAGDAGGSLSVRSAELLARAGSGASARRSHLVVWRLYWIDGRFVAGDLAAKLAGMWSRLRGHGDEGAALVFYADGETVAASHATLQAFVQSNLAALGSVLQATQAAR